MFILNHLIQKKVYINDTFNTKNISLGTYFG
jgi:hypothetical protein